MVSEATAKELRQITADDIAFLNALQEEMNTQPHLCQADPRFWVVMTHEYRACAEDDSIDLVTFYTEDGDNYSMTFEQALKTAHKSNVDFGGDDYAQEKLYDCYLSIDADGCIGWVYERDAKKLIEKYAEARGVSVCFETREPKIAQNTMFLTLREAEEHIVRNGYHYIDPHTFAMTAWRSPQVEQLYKILHEVDFSTLFAVYEIAKANEGKAE